MQAIVYDVYGSPDVLQSVEDQEFWLAWSVESSQIEIDGGHSGLQRPACCGSRRNPGHRTVIRRQELIEQHNNPCIMIGEKCADLVLQ